MLRVLNILLAFTILLLLPFLTEAQTKKPPQESQVSLAESVAAHREAMRIRYVCLFDDIDQSICIDGHLVDSLLPGSPKSFLEEFQEGRTRGTHVPGANAVHACANGQVEFNLDSRNFPQTGQRSGTALPGYGSVFSSTFKTPVSAMRACESKLGLATGNLGGFSPGRRGSSHDVNIDSFVSTMQGSIEQYCENTDSYFVTGGQEGLTKGGGTGGSKGVDVNSILNAVKTNMEINKLVLEIKQLRNDLYTVSGEARQISKKYGVVTKATLKDSNDNRIEYTSVVSTRPGERKTVSSCETVNNHGKRKECTVDEEKKVNKAIDESLKKQEERREQNEKLEKETQEAERKNKAKRKRRKKAQSCEGDSCYSCQSLKVWWSATQLFCHQSNWQSEKCNKMVSLQSGCPHRGLVMPDPNGADIACANSYKTSVEEMDEEECKKIGGISYCTEGACTCRMPRTHLSTINSLTDNVKNICNDPRAECTPIGGDMPQTGGGTPPPTPNSGLPGKKGIE